MSMPLICLIFWHFLSSSLEASGPVVFKNDREAKTYYSSPSDLKASQKASKDMESPILLSTFEEALSDSVPENICSFDLLNTYERNLKKINPSFNELEGALIHNRSFNAYDDTVTRILLMSQKVRSHRLTLPAPEELTIIPNTKPFQDAVKIISGFNKKERDLCLDEEYRNLSKEIINLDKSIKPFHFKTLFHEAYQKKLISLQTYTFLEGAREHDLLSLNLTLKSYLKKINNLRLQYPLKDADEKSSFVTQEAPKFSLSRRQHLLSQYTDLQIIIMGDVIKKLRTRLESPKAEILVYDRQNAIETIPLDPMERFRLAIKLLRKETTLLSTNTYFAGRVPDYMDLILSSYELGIIPASELEELSSIEEIWNPKRTFWQKADVWIRSLSSVATISLPQPFGFLPAMALVVIEMTAGKNSNNTNDPTVLF